MTIFLFILFRKGADIVWRYTEAGKRVRVSADSGKIIPKPQWTRDDFKSKDAVPGTNVSYFLPRMQQTKVLKCTANFVVQIADTFFHATHLALNF